LKPYRAESIIVDRDGLRGSPSSSSLRALRCITVDLSHMALEIILAGEVLVAPGAVVTFADGLAGLRELAPPLLLYCVFLLI